MATCIRMQMNSSIYKHPAPNVSSCGTKAQHISSYTEPNRREIGKQSWMH